MELRIEATDLPGRECAAAPGFPGYRDLHVAVQRRGRPAELLGPVPGDAPRARWSLECEARPVPGGADLPGGVDLTGRYVQGGPGARFVYLNWVTRDGDGWALLRRAKLLLAAVDREVAGAAVERGVLVARLRLTDAKGRPLCAAVRPPVVTWSAEG
ncbi:DUF5990 family protein [Kitasatospora sp. NBC_01300]|uniref:DUF5990 family protein n=1 Tax=Kitasatospora sp. NBC_01300 TaxID=2903574 RepID=UPI00352FA8CD|nr:DUF5990 family protein [Kitasatospora sp. NBC_01300]